MSVSRIYRLLRLITLLQSGGSYMPDELARELEVSRRTVFRDLNMLELAHIPYYFDAQKGTYRIGQHFFLPPVNLTLGEALAMLLLARRLGSDNRLPLMSEGSRAAVKVESVLPEPIRTHVGSAIKNVSLSLGPLASHEGLDGMFNELTAAIADRRVCKLLYISLHERRQMALDVHPLRLVFKARAWYLLGYSPEHKEVRTFKLGRIRKLTVGKRTFKAPADFDPDRHFGDAWHMIPEGHLYDVQLRFSARMASNVAEVRWHHSQRIVWNDDGSADFFARVDGLGEITWWIMGYGDQVEVLGPPALRNRVGSMAQAVVQRYQGAKA